MPGTLRKTAISNSVYQGDASLQHFYAEEEDKQEDE